MNIKENFDNYFSANFDITFEYFDNKMNNISAEQFEIYTCMSQFKPHTILDMSYFEIDKHSLLAFYLVEIENQEFIYFKKFRTIKCFEFHFNLFCKNREDIMQLYSEIFIDKKDFFEIFEYFVGDYELFSTMKSVHLIKLFKLNEDNFFCAQLFAELLLINCSLHPYSVKGRIINNFDSEYLLAYLLKPVKAKNSHIIKSVAGLYSHALETCYYFQNKSFYEIFFQVLENYKSPGRIYLAAINFFHKKFSIFGSRPYAQTALNNFNLEFLNKNHDVFFKKEPVLAYDEEAQVTEQNYITLYNLWTIKNKNYYCILKLKETLAVNYHKKTYLKLAKDQDNPENRFKILDILVTLENYFKTKFISNNIINSYFNNQKIYFI